jgi:pimeloyl-ACP methyl ester carboxylesterase
MFNSSLVLALAVLAAGASATAAPAVKPVNVVLVHGAFADGSGWRGVYEELTRRGFRVSIVQNPLTSLADVRRGPLSAATGSTR